ncbi:hypothetical protein [Paenibacillus sp. YN15]|uniref:hypothetical protein n=1 Tax=Paenibacillus sp. YN15 TaxID=1742774 RepID=UPI000DCE7BF5|nr:hypothetical protein [Paenibacillus sp. YN15]RAU95551.1 hypothetical protein DQG13_22040 [Paenibacillus sp. YN15]
MKRLLLRSVGLTACLLLTMTACSGQKSSETDAVKLGTAYKETQYNVRQEAWSDDEQAVNERLKPFLTGERYEKLLANREGYYPLFLAKNSESTVSLHSISFQPAEHTGETLEFTYTLQLGLSNGKGQTKVEKAGQMGFKKENGEWKIYRDSEEKLQEKDFPAN